MTGSAAGTIGAEGDVDWYRYDSSYLRSVNVTVTPPWFNAEVGQNVRTSLAQAVLRVAIRRREEIRFERWLYSERELEAIVRNRSARQKKSDRDAAIKQERIASKAERAAARDAERERYRAEKRRLSS